MADTLEATGAPRSTLSATRCVANSPIWARGATACLRRGLRRLQPGGRRAGRGRGPSSPTCGRCSTTSSWRSASSTTAATAPARSAASRSRRRRLEAMPASRVLRQPRLTPTRWTSSTCSSRGRSSIPSIILHEVSHGWAALRFGDDTAKRLGRLTLNPIAHVDPIGTLLLPGVLALSGPRGDRLRQAGAGQRRPAPVAPRTTPCSWPSPGRPPTSRIASSPRCVFRLVGTDVVDRRRLDRVERSPRCWSSPGCSTCCSRSSTSSRSRRSTARRWWSGPSRPAGCRASYSLRRYSMFIVLGRVPRRSRRVGDSIVDPAFDVWEALAG